MIKIKTLLISAFTFFAISLFAQTNSNCAGAAPFCTGQTMTFPASTNAGAAQTGPNYGCLGSQPNPAWYFMQIANSGSMSIAMAATNDIDFICWGPFSSLAGACNSLTSGDIQSCSYSGSPTETCTIANAVAGQFYLMLITNFSNSTQNITFNQNNAGQSGAATTNCGFVCIVTPTTSGVVCAGQAITLSLAPGTSTSTTSYTWAGSSAFTSTSSLVTFTNVQASATYTIFATSSALINSVPYSGTCSAVISTSVIQYPTFSVTPTTTDICQGGSFFAGVTFTPAANPTGFFYSWSPSSGAGVWQPGSVNTLISPNLLPTTTTISTLVYSVTVWPTNTVVTCPITKTLAVTINNPITPSLTVPAPFCDTFAPSQLIASPGGGTWTANPALAVTQTGLFTPSLALIAGVTPVYYAVSVGTCIVTNSMSVAVSKFNTAALSSSLSMICEQDPVYNLMNIVQSTVNGTWSGTQVNSSNLFDPNNLASGNYSLTYNTLSNPNASVCPASTVLVVSIFNPPIPIIDPIAPKCTNATTVSLTATPLGGLWSGNLGVSPTGIQTPSNNSIGSNTVFYSAGIGTCIASSSQVFHVSQYNSPALTGTVPHLCVSSNPFNLMSIVQNTNGVWLGQGTNLGTAFNPSALATNIYTISYHSFSLPQLPQYANLCPDSSKISVSVLNPQMPSIVQVGPFCSIYSAIQLSVSPATGSWIPSSYLSASGVFSPSLSAVGNNAVQYVIGTSTCFAQQTKSISTEAFVSAAISSTLNDQCSTNPPLVLSPFTLSNLGTWSGSGIVGASFNPALSGAGNFILSHYTSSNPSGLCPDQATVSVQVFSLAAPSISKEGPFCNNKKPIQLVVSPIGGLFSSGVSGLVSSAGLFNPSRALIGENIITYSIASGPCIANVTTTISIEKFISADFEKYPANAYCKNSAPFNLNSLVQNPGGFWTGNGTNSLGMFDPTKAEIGNNLIRYETHSDPTFNLCPDFEEITIKVKNVPTLTLQSSNTGGCAPFTLNIKALSDEPGNLTWIFGDGSTLQNNTSVSHVFDQSGTYSIVVNYSDLEAEGCTTQVKFDTPILVNESPIADFSIYPEEISIANPEVSLTNQSTVLQENKYTWTITGLNQVYDIHPQVYFPQIGKYKITLNAVTKDGCKNEISKTVEVKNDFNCFIPNSFSPNYDDLNDVFIPVFSSYGLDYSSFKMEIYDRWGHELYSTKDITKGWDGTFKNEGEVILKEDTYIYKIRFKDIEGKSYNKYGNVSIIK